MKKILFTLLSALLLMAMPQEAKASHAAGGEITYKYIGNAANPYKYCVTLTVYRDTRGATIGATQSITISSSCFGNQTISLTRDSVSIPKGYNACVDPNDPSSFSIDQNTYSNCNVTLPGKCTDYKFSWSLCCRNGAISNLVNPSSENLYLESKLNNTIGPNTSGSFLNPAAKSFCINQPFTWSQAAAEPDGDSIYYRLGTPLDGIAGGASTPIAWAAGFSTAQPMTTLNGFNLNNRTGTFLFTPTQNEVDVIKIVVDEYRYDTVFGVWINNGSIFREVQLPIQATCDPVAQQGITIDTNITGPGGTTAPTTTLTTDSLRELFGITAIGNDSVPAPGGGYNITVPGVPYDCFDSVVNIGFSTKLKCSTFSPNGSEFRIIGPDGVMRPVVAVDTKCGTDLLTDNVDLILHKPLDTNGSYLLYLKTGDDGDVLQNECGFSINPFFAILIDVNNCPVLDYRMLNTSVERDIDIRIDWEADNTTFSENVFTTWQILRANNDDQFYKHETVDDINARTYLDTTLSGELVDGSPFQYAVQLVQNFKAEAPTNSIRSILLTQANNGDSSSTFTWTAYDGFDNDTIPPSADSDSSTYEFEGGIVNGGVPQWANIWGPAANTGVYSHLYDWPKVAEGDSVVYAYRVKATEPQNPNNPFISESNWVYLQFKTPLDPVYDDPETGDITNVFTPNGDFSNELFLLTGNTYSNVSVSVYNRWGKLVYEDLDAPKEDYHDGGTGWDGRDQNSGNLLADGTYYIVLDFNDEPTGKSEQIKGTVNIFTSGTR